MTKIEIAFSKKKNVLLVLGSLMFVLAGLYFIYDPNGFKYSPSTIRIIGIISIIFFTLCGYLITKKLFSKENALVISNEGILDNTNLNPPLLVKWNDIKSMSMIKIGNQKVVLLQISNPEYYINQASGIKKQIMNTNFKSYGSPICLSGNSLQISTDTLYQIIDNELKSRS